MAKKFYAVSRGRNPGVFDSWSAAEAEVRGFSRAMHHSFPTQAEAQQWLTVQQRLDAAAADQKQNAASPPRRASPRRPSRSPSSSPASPSPPSSSSPPFSVVGPVAGSFLCPREKPKEDRIYSLYCDGASRHNPGPSGCGGALFTPEVRPLAEFKHFIPGSATNNVAEYEGLVKGLTIARLLRIDCIRIKCDSMTIVQQSAGSWRVTAEHLRDWQRRVQALLLDFEWWELRHIPRELNSNADRLSNEAIDERSEDVVIFRGAVDSGVQQRVRAELSRRSRSGAAGRRAAPAPSPASVSSSSSSASSSYHDRDDDDDDDRSPPRSRQPKRIRYSH